jgi:hypothetical protein
VKGTEHSACWGYPCDVGGLSIIIIIIIQGMCQGRRWLKQWSVCACVCAEGSRAEICVRQGFGLARQ